MATNLQNQFGANRSFSVHAPLPRPFTRYQIRETQRREKILTSFHALRAQGFSQAKAAKQLRQCLWTLLNWKKRVLPLTDRCGGKSSFDRWAAPSSVVARVQRLQLAGSSNADAWRAVADEKCCPANLANFLRTAKTIPPSFLRASRLTRATARVIKGHNFQVLSE